MNALALIAVGIAVLAVGVAAAVFFATTRREGRREAVEQAMARAGYEYLAKHGISCRAIGVVLADGTTSLLIETPPHKKLRFSFVIEPAIKTYVKKMAGVEPQLIFWRFPIDEAQARKNAGRSSEAASDAPAEVAASAAQPSPAKPAAASASSDGLDDYLHQHHSYHIEEVSWSDFNNTVSGEAAESAPTPVAAAPAAKQ